MDDLIAEGNEVAYRWTARGTQQGEFLGVAQTGKGITATGMVYFRFAAGKIAESWINWDAWGLIQQLGASPAPART